MCRFTEGWESRSVENRIGILEPWGAAIKGKASINRIRIAQVEIGNIA